MNDQLWIALAVAAAIVILPLVFLWFKGRPIGTGNVFRASRLSKGNRFFPTQVMITPTSVVHYTPEFIGRREQSIHLAHVASVSINTNMLFSDVIIETSGGTEPVKCYGHRKQDAMRMKTLIEQHQTAYYRAPRETPDPGRSTPSAV